jgi:Fe2+ transport system protein FeoA
MPELTLDCLKPGDCAVVKSCLGEGAVFQRLCEMGFVEGVPLRVVRYAPLGDPMQVELYGYHVSLRKSEAASIQVVRTLLEPACGAT